MSSSPPQPQHRRLSRRENPYPLRSKSLEAAEIFPKASSSKVDSSPSSSEPRHQTQHHHLPTHQPPHNPLTTSTFQTLPTSILLQIFQSLDRHDLTFFFHTLSHHLKSAANLVLTERLALGIAMCRGTEPFDMDQIRRKIMLCASVKGVGVGWEVGKGVVDRKGSRVIEVDVERGTGTSELCVSTIGVDVERNVMEGKVVGESNDLEQDAKAVNNYVEDIKEKEDADHAITQLHSIAETLTINTDSFAGTNKLPDEIVLQILAPQSHKLLKSLLALKPCQPRRVAETILFERRCEKLKSPVRRKRSRDKRSECGLWPAVNEKGEDYLGWKFIMVNCGARGDRERGLGSDRRQCIEQLSLGSYWKVVCEDVDISTTMVHS